MHPIHRTAVFVLGILAASVVTAQTVTVGNLPANPNFGFNQTPVTLIDLSNPANASGNLTNASFTWSVTPCPAAAKIKFFRPTPNGSFAFLAERGPYDITALTSFVFLSPPVAVQAGDLIGITRLTNCGSPVGQTPGAAQGLLGFAADVTSTVTAAQGSSFPNATLSVQATGTVTQPPPSADPTAVIPVVGSTPGALGQAFFRTSVQMFNPGTVRMTGKLVYHPAGTSAAAGDPSLNYVIEPGETRSIADLLPAMGLTGLGSLDVFADAGTATPVFIVRVFNDGGAAGTTGFNEEQLKPSDALSAGARGYLIAPPDSALYRYNVGVRTFGSGATLMITARNANGAVTRTVTRTYPPNYFEQRDSGAFLNGAAVAANESLTIQVIAGSAIVYGATVDNHTNDPSYQLAEPAP